MAAGYIKYIIQKKTSDMEEEYEEIDKIIDKVLKDNLATATGHNMVTILRELAKEALNEGFRTGYEKGYDDGHAIGLCEEAGE
jgi:flagellar biosynthesis/type III secretory pathway protein FliH